MWAAREAKLDDKYFNGWTESPFPKVSMKLKDVCHTLSVHDHVKEIMWWVALNIRKNPRQKAMNRRFPEKYPTKKFCIRWTARRPLFSRRNLTSSATGEMQTGVYAQVPSNLPAPIMNPIVDWAKLTMAKAGFKTPPATMVRGC